MSAFTSLFGHATEPPDVGGTFATATAMGLGVPVTGHVGTGGDQIDMYSFVATRDGAFFVDLSGLSADIDLAIFDGAGLNIAWSNAGGGNPEHTAFQVTAGATYYFEVYKFSGHSDYSLLATYDPFTGTTGDDTLVGDAGNNRLLGLEGNDSLVGDAGSDTIYGGDGSDLLQGDSGADWIYGGYGEDSLFGGQDGDVMVAGANNDVLVAGDGADTLFGGAGLDHFDITDTDNASDTIVFQKVTNPRADGQREQIVGFVSGTDHLLLSWIDADHSLPGRQHLVFGGDQPTVKGLWAQAMGQDMVISVDNSGDGVADVEIVLVGVTSVIAADFFL